MKICEEMNTGQARPVRKRDYDRAVPRTISMSQLLLDRATDRARGLGFNAFSDYIQDLVRRDTMASNPEVR